MKKAEIQSRYEKIIDLFRGTENFSLAQIQEKFKEALLKTSRVTLIRDLNYLVDSGRLQKKKC